METLGDRRSSRPPKPTLSELRENCKSSQEALISLLKNDPLSFEGVPILKSYVCDLKASREKFIQNSRALSSNLISQGALTEARDEKRNRLHLIEECSDMITVVNQIFTKLGEDEVSNADIVSISASMRSGISQGKLSSSAGLQGAEVQLRIAEAEEQVNLEEEEIERQKLMLEQAHTKQLLDLDILKRKLERKKSAEALRAEISVLTAAQRPASILSMVSEEAPDERVSAYIQDLPPTCDSPGLARKTISFQPILSFTAPSTHPTPHFTIANPPALNTSTSTSACAQYGSYGAVHHASGLPPAVSHGDSGSTRVVPSDTLTVGSHLRDAGTIDSSVQFILTQKMLEKSTQPFDGQAYRFLTWKSSIDSRIRGLDLKPIDVIHILEANTVGKPNKLVRDFLSAGGADPTLTLQKIWDALRRRFGSSVQVANSLFKKIDEFPVVRSTHDSEKLQELSDLFGILQCNMESAHELQYLNMAGGLRKILCKLPEHLQNKWRTFGHNFELMNNGLHPPFLVFVDFLAKMSDELSNPNYLHNKPNFSADGKKTRVLASVATPDRRKCVFHSTNSHDLRDCKSFTKLPFHKRKELVKSENLCFRCLSGDHLLTKCTVSVECKICKGNHCTSMHRNSAPRPSGGAFENTSRKMDPVVPKTQSLCATICGNSSVVKSCSKTLLVDVTHSDVPLKTLRCYVILDEQSNSSFAHSSLFEYFDLSCPEQEYQLTTMSGVCSYVTGKITKGFVVRGVGESTLYSLPNVISNDHIPDTKDEIASPKIVKAHPNIARFATYFNDVDPHANVLMLLGRDCGDLMRTRCYGRNAPFAHRTSLGWAVVGSVCIQASGSSVARSNITTLKTACFHDHLDAMPCFRQNYPQWSLPATEDVFTTARDDDLQGTSIEDQKFLEIISSSITVNSSGNLEMPLPFREENPKLPSNQQAVLHRTRNTLNRLRADPDKLQQCVISMGKNIDAGHIEKVPLDEQTPPEGKAWWIPVFPVTHPKKGKVRIVFDSSAKYYGASLNSKLLQGPDINNRLKNVLLNFRDGEVGFMADIESMFYAFSVDKKDRDFLRFYWYGDNDPRKDLIQYRATVHVFGNAPSPAVAIFGLRYATANENAASCPEAEKFIRNSFYMDDGIAAAKSPEEAIKILKDARKILGKYNIRLHKIASSSSRVTDAFPASELAEATRKEFDAGSTHRTLGIAWDLKTDRLVINIDLRNKPFTRRGVLSYVNSMYDPLGITSPVTLAGKLLQRAVIPPKTSSTKELDACGWDDPLPDKYKPSWEAWKSSLASASAVSVPRSYTPAGFRSTARQLHVFCDASEEAIGYAIYLRSQSSGGEICVSLVMGNSKVAPRGATSIPRLELCAAVEAARAAEETVLGMQSKIGQVHFHCDSMVVLGYLTNETKRFSRYVTRRISAILKISKKHQWHFVSTNENPADIASRPHDPDSLANTIWFSGPKFLYNTEINYPEPYVKSGLPEEVSETDGSVSCLKTSAQREFFVHEIVRRTNNWNRAKRLVARVACLCFRWLDKVRTRLGIKVSPRNGTDGRFAEYLLINSAQKSAFPEVFLRKARDLPENHVLSSLSPFIDANGLIRVGGRVKNYDAPIEQKYPILLPVAQPISIMILDHYHRQVLHQGRHVTHGALRAAGYYLMKGKSVIRRFISQCFICRRLRSPLCEQKMAQLPRERLETTAPFTHTGVDVFGPFFISEGAHTRRTKSTKKVWMLLFTCLISRAVHVESLPKIDTVSLQNALRRFFARRGVSSTIRSDQGTNFVGAQNQKEDTISFSTLAQLAEARECRWVFNPPGASHFGGVWERKIGSIRRVLDAVLLQVGQRNLNRDEFDTFVQEAVNIVNNTPLWEVSSDPEDPGPISPAMLLTLREDPNPPQLENFNIEDLLAYGRTRWRRVQYLADQFWTRWRDEQIDNLRHRRKWKTTRRNIKEGDIVLVKDKCLKRNDWPIGRVTAVTTSRDGLVRSAFIDIPTRGVNRRKKSFERPVCNLVFLTES